MTLEQRLQEVIDRGEAARVALTRLRQIDAAVRAASTKPRDREAQ